MAGSIDSRTRNEIVVDQSVEDQVMRAVRARTESHVAWSLSDTALPDEVVELIDKVLAAVADGAEVRVGRLPEVITTTTAAQILGISRPTLMRKLKEGELASHKVGTHTRLHTADVQDFKQRMHQRRIQAAKELMELEEELNEPL